MRYKVISINAELDALYCKKDDRLLIFRCRERGLTDVLEVSVLLGETILEVEQIIQEDKEEFLLKVIKENPELTRYIDGMHNRRLFLLALVKNNVMMSYDSIGFSTLFKKLEFLNRQDLINQLKPKKDRRIYARLQVENF